MGFFFNKEETSILHLDPLHPFLNWGAVCNFAVGRKLRDCWNSLGLLLTTYLNRSGEHFKRTYLGALESPHKF